MVHVFEKLKLVGVMDKTNLWKWEILARVQYWRFFTLVDPNFNLYYNQNHDKNVDLAHW